MNAARHLLPAAICAAALAACAEMDPVRQGEPDLVDVTLDTIGEDRFAVSLTALNTDGYALARCLAAGFVDRFRDADGRRVHDVFRRDGGGLTDEFTVAEGVRTQTTTGIQTFAFDRELTPSDHDGRDVMAVDVQLARCDRAGLPTSVE